MKLAFAMFEGRNCAVVEIVPRAVTAGTASNRAGDFTRASVGIAYPNAADQDFIKRFISAAEVAAAKPELYFFGDIHMMWTIQNPTETMIRKLNLTQFATRLPLGQKIDVVRVLSTATISKRSYDLFFAEWARVPQFMMRFVPLGSNPDTVSRDDVHVSGDIVHECDVDPMKF